MASARAEIIDWATEIYEDLSLGVVMPYIARKHRQSRA